MRYEQVYLDNISSAPTPEEVCDVMSLYYREHFGYPGQLHQWGQWSKTAFEVFAEKTAELLGAKNFSVKFVLEFALPEIGDGKILISPIEAGIIRDAVERSGIATEEFDMDGYRHNISSVDKILREDKIALVIAAAADRLTGTIQPIRELAEICHRKKIPLLCDISPLIGRTKFAFSELGADFGFIEGRLFGAPCNLVIGEQPDEKFPLPLAAGFFKTLEIVDEDIEEKLKSLDELTNEFWRLLQLHLPHLVLLGEEPRLSGILTVAFEDVDRGAMMLALDMQGVAIWGGDSFSKPTEQFVKMNISEELAECALRFSLWHNTKQKELDYVLRVLPPLVDRIRFEKKSPKMR